MKTLIEIHILQNFAPSNLNRDDTGAPKDALFGGARRARISSQCLKRSVRQYFGTLVQKDVLAEDDIATRTKRVSAALTKALIEKGRPESESLEKSILALAAMELKVEDEKSQYLLFLGKREIQEVARIIDEKWEIIVATENATIEGKKAPKVKKQAASNADPELKKALDKVFDGGKALDLALFGRMLADMPAKNHFAACQVAHALSTHSVEREFDFFTAVDDLKPDDTTGADMMGTVEFNSACFYRYAVVDWHALVHNLQGDIELAEKGLRAFLEGFIISEPTGKQNTFAAHNPPEFAMISVRHDSAPRNLANAFEIPVWVKKNESLTQVSAEKLVEKAKSFHLAFGGNGNNHLLNLTKANFGDFGRSSNSLVELLDAGLGSVRN